MQIMSSVMPDAVPVAEPAPRLAPQAPAHLVMVRPHQFTVNPATAADNAFQQDSAIVGRDDVMARGAYDDVTRLAGALRQAGVGVSMFEDESGTSPDSVFPNNWFTTHPDGRVLLCPMYAVNRRAERRSDVIEHLRGQFNVTEVLDWSAAEDHGQFLEGTGSVVIDHARAIAYGCRSHRLTDELFFRFCAEFGLHPVLFDAVDPAGRPIYHTNVMMSVGEHLALIGAHLIPDPAQREQVLDMLRASGRTVVELDGHQIASFAGNALELRGAAGQVLAMSTRAEASLRPDQREAIAPHARIMAVDVSTVEASGGSVRCMLAGIHLPPP